MLIAYVYMLWPRNLIFIMFSAESAETVLRGKGASFAPIFGPAGGGLEGTHRFMFPSANQEVSRTARSPFCTLN